MIQWSTSGTNDADFYTSGTSPVTVSGSISVRNITFDGSGYTLSGGTLSLTGSITTNQSATIGSILAGTSGLTKAGTGDLILTGSETYSGATNISNGTLQVGSGGTTGSIGSTSSVSDSGVLAFDRSDNISFALAVSGNGSLVQLGTGALILTGSNTYSGQTTISTGTLQVGSGGTTGSINSTSGVSDSGVLEFDRSDNITFSPAISGSGGLVQAGTGTLILTGSNTYSGGTTISAGTLQLNNANAAQNSTVTVGSRQRPGLRPRRYAPRPSAAWQAAAM